MKEYFNWNQFDNSCQNLVNKIDRNKYRDVYGVPRGGVVLAVRLSHRLGLLYRSCLPLASTTLVVDDVADSGNTLKPYIDSGLDVATIHYKKRSIIVPTYWDLETENWIVYPWEVL